ncbi:hypothetical protein Efla_005012 [Eimeria flavescens]
MDRRTPLQQRNEQQRAARDAGKTGESELNLSYTGAKSQRRQQLAHLHAGIAIVVSRSESSDNMKCTQLPFPGEEEQKFESQQSAPAAVGPPGWRGGPLESIAAEQEGPLPGPPAACLLFRNPCSLSCCTKMLLGGKRAVLDLGTGSIKAGWAGEGRARYLLPTCAGAVRRRPQLYLSEECYSLQEYICSRPSQGGLWTNLELLRDLLDLAFSKKYLASDVRELGGVTLTEPLLTPAPVRHQLTEILFEDLGAERLAVVAAQAVVPYAFWGMAWGAHDICLPAKGRRMGVTCYSGSDPRPAAPLPAQQGPSQPAAGGPGLGVGGGAPSGGPAKAKMPAAASASSPPGDPCFSPRLAAAAAAAGDAAGGHVSAGRNPFGLIVDVGFSASHAVPNVNYSVLEAAALRADLKEETCFLTADLVGLLSSLQKLPGGRRAAHLGGPLLVEREMPDYSLTTASQCPSASALHCGRQSAVCPLCVCEEQKAQLAAYFHTHSPAPLPDLSAFGGHSALRSSSSSSSSTHGSEPSSSKGSNPTTSSSGSGGEGEKAAAAEAPCVAQPAEGPPAQGPPAESEEVTWAPPTAPARPSVRLSTERVVVPEILFHPQADGGSSECGVAELAYRAICKAPLEAQPFLASQIFLVGGSSRFPGFRERLWTDLRGLLPEHWPVNIYQHEDPQHSAWLGASNWTQDDGVYLQFSVSRQQFLETGFA